MNHENVILGGKRGAEVLFFLRRLSHPAVVLEGEHSILSRLSPKGKKGNVLSAFFFHSCAKNEKFLLGEKHVVV